MVEIGGVSRKILCQSGPLFSVVHPKPGKFRGTRQGRVEVKRCSIKLRIMKVLGTDRKEQGPGTIHEQQGFFHYFSSKKTSVLVCLRPSSVWKESRYT